jgi:F-type H+-transporting ATPase subunit epsilon
MRLKVSILTPNCVFRKTEAEQLILPTSTGQIGVLPGHAPLITALDIGPIISLNKSTWTACAVIGGFAMVQGDYVTVLVNEAVDPSSVKKADVEKSLEAAKDRLNAATEDNAKVAATLSFKRERARFLIVQ